MNLRNLHMLDVLVSYGCCQCFFLLLMQELPSQKQYGRYDTRAVEETIFIPICKTGPNALLKC